MTWYAETGPVRTRQLLADALLLLWVLLSVRVGTSVHDAVQQLARPGRELGRWRRGEPGAAEALAALERRAYGLRA
jgi:hypothetical protein